MFRIGEGAEFLRAHVGISFSSAVHHDWHRSLL